jgi:hypothetical protein
VIDVGVLPMWNVLIVETDYYLYKLTVISDDGIVEVETGDSKVGDGTLCRVGPISQDNELSFNKPNFIYHTAPVTRLEINGVSDDGSPWSYQVF